MPAPNRKSYPIHAPREEHHEREHDEQADRAREERVVLEPQQQIEVTAHLSRVFDRFFTYRPQEPGRRDHAGLGLAIARTIVEGYGGTIAASNREGGGASVEVMLPTAKC